MSRTEKALLREFCAENGTFIPLAIERGAGRIELCDNLAVGGTTPSIGVIETVNHYAQTRNVDVMVMVRPRGGNFHYSSLEQDMMIRDIEAVLQLPEPVSGFVLGALQDDGLDEQLLKTLIQPILSAPHSYELTFHMAFDELIPEQQLAAIPWLSAHGFTRILTHGGSGDEPIEQTLPHLQELVQAAGDRIRILPGAGITYQNAETIAKMLQVHEVHGTRIVDLNP
ncbi:MAG: copper homeostasis protein CutC [Aerococcus sp.]|nr:copper homeostasis protein CutC [Aerococcus sp.]